ncbi:MAG: Zn-dependent exopeptidase M28 [Gordonia sp.]|uniref:M28 family metallopeptidase n=1 Tax=Gordonia rubripertincta TaxID=36822 RepID=A0ABT4N797_GORRU|nr:M28 family metallopeptidase [Gordonia rubripertincta]MBA4023458.1 Zn-dependent exopeptidase M28 [Gordonia sp. (in: high G+C Gram-positive bacteria)]MCZ4553792.1 M28 family metallopeptidase [Gordonia rubripertincta]
MIEHERTCRRSRRGRIDPSSLEHPPTVQGARDPGLAALVETLSPDHYERYLTTIAAPITRHSLSPGFAAAMSFAAAELDGLGYTVTRSPIAVGDGQSENLFAHRVGTGAAPRGLVAVTAHLDSVNQGGRSLPAPGADDNASGSAGVLELGRVLAGRAWSNDVLLVLFGGEEQGLLGSIDYVESLDTETRVRLSAIINMDMIGRKNTARPGVMIEGGPTSTELMAELVAAAGTWTALSVTTSMNPFASDHVPFIDAGLPAVLTIEADDRANTDVHTAGDLLDTVDASLALEILTMNLAVLAEHLENRPSTP